MLIALLLAASPAQAADARCLALFGSVAAKGTDGQKVAARVATYFFLGKMRGRNPAADITGDLREAAKTPPARAQAELQRCSQELNAAGQSLLAAGNATRPK